MALGKVYLVGAGPGDPELLTLRARALLERADVVLYDRLISEEVLRFAPKPAERIDRGARASHAALTQEQINQLLVNRARAGKTVVRLKGGDPLVFGRGGEEAQALAQAQVPFEIVPGVTSPVGVAAAAGIPLTHRALASHVTIVSGHDASEGPPVPWKQLAQPDTTLVLLMSLHALEQNLGELRRAGVAAEMPAAVIESGTTSRQRVVVGTVGDLARRVREAGLKPPALTIVGHVVALRSQLNWMEARPLHGKRVLVTRARHQAEALSRCLREYGGQPIEMPTLELVPPTNWEQVDRAIQALNSYDWILFTSANGVAAFFERLFMKELDMRALGHARLAAIGPATAEALAAWKLRADVVAKEFLAEGLIEALTPHGISGKRFLLPRAKQAREILPDTIRTAGGMIDVVTVYQAVVPQPDPEVATQLRSGVIDVVTFTSSGSAENFAAMGLSPRRAHVAAIGPVTRATCERLGFAVTILPPVYTVPALAQAIADHFGHT